MVVWMLPQEQAEGSQPLLLGRNEGGQVCELIPISAYQPGDLTQPFGPT